MELWALRYFLAVVENQGFTRAAESLHLTQPSVSHAVKGLERELGVRLFRRSGRGVLPTEAGIMLAEHAGRLLRHEHSIQAAIASIRGLAGGRVSATAPPSMTVSYLVPWVAELQRRHPGVKVDLAHCADSADATGRVRRGELDLAVVEHAAVDDRLVRHRCRAMSIVAAFPPGTRVPENQVRLGDLTDHPWVASLKGTRTRAVFDEAAAKHGLRVVATTETREALVPLVLAGVGATLLAEPFAELASARGAVVRPLRPKAEMRIDVIHRRETLTPAASAFVQVASEDGLHAEEAAGQEAGLSHLT